MTDDGSTLDTVPDPILAAILNIADEVAAADEEVDSSTVAHTVDSMEDLPQLPVTANHRLSGAPKRYATITRKFLIHRRTTIPYSVDDIVKGMLSDD